MARDFTTGQDLVRRKGGSMNLKWIGVAVIVLGCGGFGFLLSASHRQQTKELRQLLSALDLISCELSYRMTPLPQLCLLAGDGTDGNIKRLFFNLNTELEQQIAPDAGCCMNAVLAKLNLSSITKQLLRNLGRSLGRFDLEGQLRGIDAVRHETLEALEKLTHDQDERLRSYQTLGLCAGAALAILLL